MDTLQICRFGNRQKREVALTFDDGPNPYSTIEILKILSDFNVSATFFVLGIRCQEYPKLLKEIISKNHLIGNHSYSHAEGDYLACEHIVKLLTGDSMQFVRPPYYNLSYCLRETDYLQDKIIITGDIDSEDYLNINESKVYENVISKIQCGSIIDFHDGSEVDFDLEFRSKKTINILPKIIEKLLSLDFKLLRIDELDLKIREICI